MSKEDGTIYIVNDSDEDSGELVAAFWTWDEANIFIDMVDQMGDDKPPFGRWFARGGPSIDEINIYESAEQGFKDFQGDWE